MRHQKLGLCGVVAVLAIIWMIASTVFEAAQTNTGPQSAAVTPSDPGTPMAVLRGKIRFNGTVPPPQSLNMLSDPMCAPFVAVNENIQISDQGLENVMVYVSSPVLGSTPIGSVMTLDQYHCRFDPHVLTVQAGQTLFIRNSDNTLNNVHAFTQVNSPFNIGQPVPMVTDHVFDKPEAQIPIRDDVHKWKSAYIGVFAHPYHTVSKAGGRYELRLPAGSYEITAWHEKYGTSQQSVSVGPGENPALDFVYNEP